MDDMPRHLEAFDQVLADLRIRLADLYMHTHTNSYLKTQHYSIGLTEVSPDQVPLVRAGSPQVLLLVLNQECRQLGLAPCYCYADCVLLASRTGTSTRSW